MMKRRDITILGISFALLGIGVFRLLWPGGLPTRQLSVEAVVIPSAPIKSGAALDQEASWAPPDDVFIVGWAPTLGAPSALPELHLLSGTTTVFSAQSATIEALKPTFFPSGTGFLVKKGESLRLQLKMKNSGPDGETQGARALIYFHPVAWR